MQKLTGTGFLIFTFLLCAGTLTSQEYRIHNYGVTEGIVHPFVYTINQDINGYIWVGTGEGLCRFNGFTFDTDLIQDSLAGQVAGVSYKDSRQYLWFGYQNGNLGRYDGYTLQMVHHEHPINSAINGFAELKDGAILVASQNNGLYVIDPVSLEVTITEGIEQGMYTALCVEGNTLLLGSYEGLSIYSIDNSGNRATLQVGIDELDFTKIQDIQPASMNNAFWIATEDQGLFQLVLNGEQYTLTSTGVQFDLGNKNVQAVFEDINKHLWISTLRNGIYILRKPDGKGGFGSIVNYNKQKGLPGNAIKRVFEDIEGNIWVATYGDGISLLTSQSLTFTDLQVAGIANDVLSVAISGTNVWYIGGQGGLYSFNKESGKAPIRIAGIPPGKVTALYLNDPYLFVGTEMNGLFALNITNNQIQKIQYEAYSMGYRISAIASDQDYLYVGTKDGIYQFDHNFHVVAHYTTNNGLPHNNIEHVFIDSQNRLLFATKTNGIYELTSDGKVNNLYSIGNAEIEFKSIAEDENGNIWAATYGEGVIHFKNDSVYQFTTSSGLKANYCYSLIRGAEGTIWVGHRLGISRINVRNTHIRVYDQRVGITGDCNLNAVYRTNEDIIYFGTTEGLISYDPSRDVRKQLPPFTNIVNVLISDKPYDFSHNIVLPYRLYKLRIDFIGLNYSNPEGVSYQYKLRGHDLEWSDIITQTSVTYSRIEDGEYTFLLRAFNSDGLSVETPTSFALKIKPPVWKTWWFISLAVLMVTFSVLLIVKIREHKQKQLQEYLERELAARTKEVVEQKEEIEIKNRDITDSINYAKRIQTSMLPPVKRLQQHFAGSFVFYSPRDIVSGDFYWFDKVNDNKFTIVCADSTGHGVPGAFMSMIGSTLIKDICSREAGNSPSKILQVLDCELRNTLNQNMEDTTKPSDGMDIIVCEIDLKTHYVRYASAMRPMIIYRNGEEIFIKGSRNSVGGHYEKEDNLFEDEGLQLGVGDIIYMFSDGYSDQFGGPMGKKFKMVRLKNLLKDIHIKPMDEQCLHVKNTFNLWKENYDQVDDVLFMGIKL